MSLPDEVESHYYLAQGFDSAHTRRVLSHYLPYLKERSFLVDLGCGRGELLELAHPLVGRVLGVDVDAAMVDEVRRAGLDAVQGDVRDWVATTDERPDAVFMAHLIEHLDVGDAFGLLASIAQIVEPGATLIVVTPNPACLANLTNDFWSDPTHRRLYTPDLLRFLVEQAGFTVAHEGANPANHPGPPPELLAPPIDTGDGAESPWVTPRAPIQYEESLQLETLLEEIASLRRSVEGLVHVVDQLQGHQRELTRLTGLLAARHDATLELLWGPNEIYVVAERQG